MAWRAASKGALTDPPPRLARRRRILLGRPAREDWMPFADRGARPRPQIRPNLAAARHEMVDVQLAGRDIRDAAVLNAMRVVLREAFVPPDLIDSAYDDGPLPIGSGQTISQPYVVASMIAAAAPKTGDRALEIGTGSGRPCWRRS
jgi:hypothetical protein